MNYRFFIFCAERDTIAHQRGGQRSEFRVQGSGFRVQGSEIRVQSSEVSFWLLASGFLIPYFLFLISYFFLFIHALVIGFWLLASGFRPVRSYRVLASGRSWASRMLRAGKLRMDDSSEMVYFPMTSQ